MSARKPSPGPPPDRAWGIADPALLAGVWVPQSPCLLLGLQCSLSRSVGGEAWPSCVRVPLRPVRPIPCRGHVLHGTRLNEALAMTMLAVPSCVPVSAPQQASACARALSTVTSCQPHCNSSQPFAPASAARAGACCRRGALRDWREASQAASRAASTGMRGRLRGTPRGDTGEVRGDAGAGGTGKGVYFPNPPPA